MSLTVTDTGDGVFVGQGFSDGFSLGFAGPIVKVSGHLMKPVNCVLAGNQYEPGDSSGLSTNAMKSIFRE